MKRHLLPAAISALVLSAKPLHAAQVSGNYQGDGYAAQVTEPVPGTFHITGWQHGLPGSSRKVRKVAEADGAQSGAQIVFNGKDWSALIELDEGLLVGRYSNGQVWKLRKVEK